MVQNWYGTSRGGALLDALVEARADARSGLATVLMSFRLSKAVSREAAKTMPWQGRLDP